MRKYIWEHTTVYNSVFHQPMIQLNMLFSDQEVWFKLEFKIQVNLEDFLIDPRGFDPWHI